MARRKKPTYDINQPGLFDDIFAAAPAQPKPQSESEPEAEAESRPKSRRVTSGGRRVPRQADIDLLGPIETAQPKAILKYISFGSGSSGNCAYLGNDRLGLLIDAGVDPDKVVNELQRNGIAMTTVGGIILTHDHADHIRYAYALVRRFQHMRIYCTPKTLNGILRRHNISRRIKDYHQPIFKEFPFHLSDFVITPFEVYHDGSDNVGFSIEGAGHIFVVATDMGAISERADYYMRRANHLMIESNYDLTMLMRGPYPEYLKARILAQRGHMDNKLTSTYLAKIYTPALRNVFLCHLSNDNNTPDIALSDAVKALRDLGLDVGDGSGSLTARLAPVQVLCLPRYDSTGILPLTLP